MKSRVAMVGLLAALLGQAAPGWVEARKDGKGFTLSPSGAAFVPWGFNYDRDYRHRLLEDYWDREWSTVERDFREMKTLGANVVRIHLQFARFMDAADQPNPANLARLGKLVGLAEDLGLYLDITGLGSFRSQDIPRWYSGLHENEHWAAQARFWEAIATTCAGRPGVFAYNLMNEPVVSGEKRTTGTWVHPAEVGGYHYVEFVNLDLTGRSHPEVARQWIRRMVEAIRQHDRRHLVTVGLMLVDLHQARPEEAAGFPPAEIAREVDFLSLHLYPEKGEVDLAMDVLSRYRTGKPLVIEETYLLKCGVPEFQTFLERSRGISEGWLGFYWGQTPEQLKDTATPAEQRTFRWLELFRKMDPNREVIGRR